MSGPTIFDDNPILGDGITPTLPEDDISIENRVDGRTSQIVVTYHNDPGATISLDVYVWDGARWINTGDALFLTAGTSAVAVLDYGCWIGLYGTPSASGDGWYVLAGRRIG